MDPTQQTRSLARALKPAGQGFGKPPRARTPIPFAIPSRLVKPRADVGTFQTPQGRRPRPMDLSIVSPHSADRSPWMGFRKPPSALHPRWSDSCPGSQGVARRHHLRASARRNASSCFSSDFQRRRLITKQNCTRGKVPWELAPGLRSSMSCTCIRMSSQLRCSLDMALIDSSSSTLSLLSSFLHSLGFSLVRSLRP